MKTKVQKEIEIKKGQELLSGSKSLLYANFSGMSAENLRQLRRTLLERNAKFFVTKKRLLKRVLSEKGIDFDTKENIGSIGTVFSDLPPEEVSSIVYKFLKDSGSKTAEEMAGGYDIEGKVALTAEDVIALGKLPSREVLIAQIMGMMVAPLRSFMYILQEKSKQAPAAEVSVSVETAAKEESSEPAPEVKPEETKAEGKPQEETKEEVKPETESPTEEKKEETA